MKTTPISFRPLQAAAQAIAGEIKSSNNTIDTTAAIERLILRGADRPEPVYVVSGISRLGEIEAAIRISEKLLRRLDEIKSRLGGPLNPAVYTDYRRQRNVKKWRIMAERLPRHVEKAASQLRHLTALLQGGLTREELNALRTLQKALAAWERSSKVTLETKKMFQESQKILAKVFGMPPSEPK
jgi:hypothetical protein